MTKYSVKIHDNSGTPYIMDWNCQYNGSADQENLKNYIDSLNSSYNMYDDECHVHKVELIENSTDKVILTATN